MELGTSLRDVIITVISIALVSAVPHEGSQHANALLTDQAMVVFPENRNNRPFIINLADGTTTTSMPPEPQVAPPAGHAPEKKPHEGYHVPPGHMFKLWRVGDDLESITDPIEQYIESTNGSTGQFVYLVHLLARLRNQKNVLKNTEVPVTTEPPTPTATYSYAQWYISHDKSPNGAKGDAKDKTKGLYNVLKNEDKSPQISRRTEEVFRRLLGVPDSDLKKNVPGFIEKRRVLLEYLRR